MTCIYNRGLHTGEPHGQVFYLMLLLFRVLNMLSFSIKSEISLQPLKYHFLTAVIGRTTIVIISNIRCQYILILCIIEREILKYLQSVGLYLRI